LLHGDIAVEFGLLLRLLATHGVAIDGEEKLAFGDVLPFGEGNGSNRPGDARLDVDTLDGLNVPYGRDLKRHILRHYADNMNGDTLRRRCIGVGHDARTRRKRDADQDAQKREGPICLHVCLPLSSDWALILRVKTDMQPEAQKLQGAMPNARWTTSLPYQLCYGEIDQGELPVCARDAREEDGARCLQKERGWLQMSWWHRVDSGS
jgi:hypothetical protein